MMAYSPLPTGRSWPSPASSSDVDDDGDVNNIVNISGVVLAAVAEKGGGASTGRRRGERLAPSS